MDKNLKFGNDRAAIAAARIFDSIAGASYYGLAFRDVLRNDPEALAAAEKLVERLRAGGVRGLD
jgi:hypothetical protein